MVSFYELHHREWKFAVICRARFIWRYVKYLPAKKSGLRSRSPGVGHFRWSQSY